MAVVCNTTPLNYLILTGDVDLLLTVYAQVLVPESVIAELRHPRAPEKVREWVASLPEWIGVRPVLPTEDPVLNALERGERDAILLQKLSATFL